jgi:hypothetical protein
MSSQILQRRQIEESMSPLRESPVKNSQYELFKKYEARQEEK